MMQQTIAQIYQSIAEGIKAVRMKVGDRRDLSNEFGIKFYIATFHTMKDGKPIIVAGIHALPFNRDYSVNFTMTTFYEAAATAGERNAHTGLQLVPIDREPETGNSAAKPPPVKEPK
jgi:hypothetical protein